MTDPQTMVALVEDYLAHRRGLGFALRIEGGQLLSFAHYADASGHRGPPTLDVIVRWATLPSVRPRRFPGRRLDVIRPFARFCAARDPATEVPPRSLLGPARRRPVHHIFSDADVAALVAQARRLAPSGGLRPATFATLFGLLAACGLRISEALHLTCKDVDFVRGVLTVRETKFRKSRFVPLHPTTTFALRTFSDRRTDAVPRPTSPMFFTTAQGGPLPYSTVRSTFRRSSAALGWEALVPRPRIHDLRHAFACRRLQRWYADSVDVAPKIAALATYLGHAKVTDTYWYVTGTPELLSLAASRFESFSAVATGGRS